MRIFSLLQWIGFTSVSVKNLGSNFINTYTTTLYCMRWIKYAVLNFDESFKFEGHSEHSCLWLKCYSQFQKWISKQCFFYKAINYFFVKTHHGKVLVLTTLVACGHFLDCMFWQSYMEAKCRFNISSLWSQSWFHSNL